MNPAFTRLCFAMLPITLLMACGSQSMPPSAAQSVRYDYVATVPVMQGDTQQSLAAAIGGTVVTWPSASDCVSAPETTCSALIGFKTSTQFSAQSLRLRTQQLGRTVQLEPNRDVFSGGGSITATSSGSLGIWAGGSLGIWAGGSLGIWAGGTYNALPQNSATWNQINLQQAQTLAPKLGAGVKVAVIDTGIDLNDSAFQGTFTDPSTWQDFYAGGAVPQDQGTLGTGAFGHGTNVAGIILQIAPKALIMPIRVLGPDGSGDVANVAQAITWATQHGANIINLSMGSTTYSPAVQNAITQAAAANVLIVASAGNANTKQITYPAASFTGPMSTNMLSVGSVDSSDKKSSFANYQNVLELSAPGENVYAPAPGEMLAAWSGTSQAAPMATGGLALALGELFSANGSALTQIQVNLLTSKLSAAMMSKSAPLYAKGQNPGYANLLGKGRLDLAAFLSSATGN